MKMLIDAEPHRTHAMGKALFYPAETHFDENFRTGDFLNAVFSRRLMAKKQPLSIYIQFPTKKEGGATSLFFEYLKREINAQSYLFMGMNRLTRIHLLGGNDAHHIHLIKDLYHYIKDRFPFENEAAVSSIELNASSLDLDYLKSLQECGFNQLTVVIDQSQSDEIKQLASWLSVVSFNSISIKIPQSLILLSSEEMLALMDDIDAIHPQQIIIENFLSSLSFNEISALQDINVETKFCLFQRWIDAFNGLNYVHLGTGYWVQKKDVLVTAQREGRLHWSCYGYALELNDIVSFGIAAVSNVCGVYSKNAETLKDYYQRIEEQNLPIVKGFRLKTNDLLRRTIIYKLLCEGELSVSFIELTYPIVFNSYFEKELKQLEKLEKLGFINISEDSIVVSDKGKLVIYTICQVFDTY